MPCGNTVMMSINRYCFSDRLQHNVLLRLLKSKLLKIRTAQETQLSFHCLQSGWE
uniref:Uncharacterized protein n=1 Tax=Anguilla anguilla TaxID=7936 RepID=A0A0E9S8N9_ANGAN